MALLKAVETPFGVDALYHHVASVQTHYRERCCDVIVASYLDEAARRAGRQPLGVLPVVRLDFLALGDAAEPGREAIYAALMARPEWVGAQAA